MIYFCHSHQIEALGLFQKYEKTFARFLALKLIYLRYFNLKQMNKAKLAIKKRKSIFALLLTLN